MATTRRAHGTRRRAGLACLIGLVTLTMLVTVQPPTTSGALPYTAADQLLANSAWPTIGRNYKHQGWSPYAGPANPQTRGLAVIPKQVAGVEEEYNNQLRSAYMGEGGMLITAAGMTGFFEVRWDGGTLRRVDEFYTCCGGETWVEDVTIGRHNAVYVVNEGGFVRKVVKVGSGASARWSDNPADCHPQAGCGWRRFHGFLHAPPALYPTALAPSGVAVLIISPDGYVAALDSGNGDELWRYRYMPGSGNKESVREKGFTWNDQGHIYFPWGGTLFILRPDGTPVYTHPDGSPRHIPLGAVVTSGPVLANDGKVYLTGTGQFIQVNPSTMTARVFNMGSSTLDSAYYPRNAKERWPALSPSGDTVYYTASNGVLYAMPTAWEEPDDPWVPRWVFKYDGPTSDQRGIKSDPLVDVNGMIYFYGADQYLYQIKPDGTRSDWPGANGKKGKFGVSTVTDDFYMGTQLALDSDGTIYVASYGPSGSNGNRNVVWAVGPGGASPTHTPTRTATPISSTATPVATPTRTPTPVPGAAPAVTISAPADGATLPLYGAFPINASASGATGIATMRIYGNGALLKTCMNVGACSTWWSPPAGVHTILVTATSSGGQTGQDSITVSR
jgi:hypothetical protein